MYRSTLREKRCKICDEFLLLRRVERFPQAVLCGAEKCKSEHARRCRNRVKKKWRNSRAARDPAWHARQKAVSAARNQRRQRGSMALFPPNYTPPAEGAPDSADPGFRARVRPCGRCREEFTTSAKWRYFCPNCRRSPEVHTPASRRTYAVSSGRRSGGV